MFRKMGRYALAVCVLAALACPVAASAQTYPSKPIRFVVPYAPAGVVDNTARLVGERVGRELGQPVVIDNRPGANGQIGTEVASKAAADGYTFLVTSVGFAYRQHLVKVPYDPFNDFEPISLLNSNPLFLVINSKIPVTNVKELVEYSQGKPGGLTYGTSGTGGPTHLAGELFKLSAGIEMIHVPYRGDGLAVADLLGGNLDLTVSSASATASHIKAGKLRAIAVMSNRRSPFLPDVPTVAEAGNPNIVAESWVGIVAPGKLPPAIRQKVHAAITAALADPAVRNGLASGGSTIIGSQPQEFARFLKTESVKWDQVIRKAKIQIDE
jgi:tripartite-type tricarboxylate transporter receptor subunit TctC